MKRSRIVAGVIATLVVCAGCSSVQKGALIGGGTGGAVGVGVGYVASLGMSKGAVVGIPLGMATGAIIGDTYYGDDVGDLAVAQGDAQAGDPNQDLASEVETLRNALQQEQEARLALAQENSLLNEQNQAYQEALAGGAGRVAGGAPRMSMDGLVPGVTQERLPDGSLRFRVLSEVLFSSGKASLTNNGQSVLAEVARNIRRQYPDSEIEIWGHTDNVPIRYSQHKTNWELSCARALSVLHHMQQSEDFDPRLMRVSGFADTRPVASNDSPDGRRLNRRAEIIVHPRTNVAAR